MSLTQLPGFNRALRVVLGESEIFYYPWIVGAGGVFLLVLVFFRSLNCFSSRRVRLPGVVLGAMLGLPIVVVGGGYALIYLQGAMGSTALVYFGMILTSMILVVPVQGLILRNGYFCVLSSWGLGVAALVIFCIGMGGIFAVVDSGDTVSAAQKKRNAGLEEILDR